MNPIKLAFFLTLFYALCTSCQTEGTVEEVQTQPIKASYPRDELSVQHGLELFNQHCATCHNFDENAIGPNLSGVTLEVEKDWLVRFISNPVAVIESGDERASQLFEKYQQYMPPFPMLSDEDVEHVLAFIHKFSQGQKRNRSNRPGGLINPVEAKIADSDIHLEIEEWLTVPASAEHPPVARINKLLAFRQDGRERLFIHDLRGTLYEIKEGEAKVYLDLAGEQSKFIDNPGWGTGLGSFAFHPEFDDNGLFYTSHTEAAKSAPADFALDDSIRTTLQWVLSEWKTEDPKATRFAGSHRELLRVDMYGGAHGLQELTFNPLAKPGEPDYGLLYLGFGDGSLALSGYPHWCNNKGKIWGSVLRIDPLGTNSANGKYGIPSSNPFVDQENALGEVWANGFRNPHRISWDKVSGKMFITNIGQHGVEEVNLGVAGADYGWPDREGHFLFDVNANPEQVYPLPAGKDKYTYPVAQYDHDEGNAVSGGFVYNGSAIPLLKGKYIFGDIPRGTLFYTEVEEMNLGQLAPIYKLKLLFNGQPTDLQSIVQNKRVDLRFGQDTSGELFIFSKSNGKLYRVMDAKMVQ